MAASLTQAAAHLAATLQQAGPDAQMWCPVGDGGTRFYARRFTHETAIHRADAALGLGVPFTLATDEPAAAEITAPVIDPLLMLYRRRPVAGLDVTGDAGLVDFWLERVAFG